MRLIPCGRIADAFSMVRFISSILRSGPPVSVRITALEDSRREEPPRNGDSSIRSRASAHRSRPSSESARPMPIAQEVFLFRRMAEKPAKSAPISFLARRISPIPNTDAAISSDALANASSAGASGGRVEKSRSFGNVTSASVMGRSSPMQSSAFFRFM